MRFLYAYKTADGVRHEDAIDAPSRDEAFAALRVKGIRPIKVIEVRARTSRRRMILLAPLALLLVAGLAVVAERSWRRESSRSAAAAVTDSDSGLIAKPRARRQLPEALFSAEALAKTFVHPSERALARFARPGIAVDALSAAECAALGEDFTDALEDEIRIASDDDTETADLKRIVAGIKLEAKMLVASGRDFAGVIAYFSAQQQMESEYRRRILESSAPESEKSAQLSALGL